MSLGFTIDNSNIFNAIFSPIVKKFAVELQKKDVHIFYADQNIAQKFPRLIFGAHSNPNFWLKNKTKEDIFVNFEPIFLHDWQIKNDSYMKLLNSSKVLDYTKKSNFLLDDAKFFTLPPLHNSIEITAKDNDVLFVGSVNERRKIIFRELFNDGVTVSIKFKIFGADLFNEIEKSKIFLDSKFNDDYLFNIFRFCLCADTNTIYVGEAGDISDYPEIEDLLGLTIIKNPQQLSKIIKEILSNQNYRENLLKTQREIAKKLEKKFQSFIDLFSKELQ